MPRVLAPLAGLPSLCRDHRGVRALRRDGGLAGAWPLAQLRRDGRLSQPALSGLKPSRRAGDVCTVQIKVVSLTESLSLDVLSKLRTLPVTPWCDLGFVPNSRGNKSCGEFDVHVLFFFLSIF